MSDPDSAQRRRPPTIDLTAQEVETARPKGGAESPTVSAASADDSTGQGGANKRGASPPLRRTTPYIVSGLIGAAAAAAIIIGLWFAGLAPQGWSAAPQRAAVPPLAQASNSKRMSEIEAQLDKLRGALQATLPDAGLMPRISNVETQTKALNDALATLTHRVDEIGQSTHDLATEAKVAAAAATAATEEGKGAAESKVQSGLDQIAKRIETLENAVKTLTADTARASSSADDHLARAAAAAAALAAVVERGAPFNAELASVTALGADENAVAALTPFAADGLSSAAALIRELVQLLPELRQATVATPKESSLIARLELNAQKLVRITRTDSAPTGDDPSSIISRIDTDARSGDITGALADIARLPPEPRALAADWVKKAQAREAAVAASRRIAAAAAAALGKPAQQ
jgi:hypothetical protein